MPGEGGTVYRKTELVGTSTVGFDDAVNGAVRRAQKTLRNVQWFEVREQRGKLTGSTIEYQVTIELGFALEDTVQ
jgi:flavin-binding protein dodecin